MKTRRMKTKNFDFIREISNLRRQIRESVQISIFTQSTFIQSAAIIVSSNYRFKDINSKKVLNEINSDVYSSLTYAMKKKIRTNASMYINDQIKMKYALFQMKNFVFDVIHIWIINANLFLSLNVFFKKVENYLEKIYLTKNAKKKLRKINMNKNETMTEYYHRMFKFWQRVKTFANERMKIFKKILKSSIAISLLERNFDNLETLLHEARKIEQDRKKMNQKSTKQNFAKQAKSAFFFAFDRIFNKITTIIFSISNIVKSKIVLIILTSQNSNAKFESISIKHERWVEIWYDETLHSNFKLNDAKQDKFSRQSWCWSCKKSKHKDKDSSCIKQLTNLNKIVVQQNSFEFSKSNSKKE